MTPVQEISVEELSLWRNSGRRHILLDVREGWELDLCRIDGALHIPMGEIPAGLDRIARDEPVVVLCHHGGRSLRVAAFLQAQGFEQAINLAGGINAWADRIDSGMVHY